MCLAREMVHDRDNIPMGCKHRLSQHDRVRSHPMLCISSISSVVRLASVLLRRRQRHHTFPLELLPLSLSSGR